MSDTAAEVLGSEHGLARQRPSFLAIGSFGFCCDSAITVIQTDLLHLSPLFARFPAFIIVTLMNFMLNRTFTFRGRKHAFAPALMRYLAVSVVGLAVNFSVYATCLWIATSQGFTPAGAVIVFCVACGTGVATVLTFIGFRTFAFRP